MKTAAPPRAGGFLTRALPVAALVVSLAYHACAPGATSIVLPGSKARAQSVDGARATARRPPARQGDVVLGVYDPHSVFAEENGVGIEHVFVFWQAMDLRDFRARLRYAYERGRTMMVTVEPFTRAVNWRDGGDRLFSDIVSGGYSREIERVCSELDAFRGRVLIRWGHEMEDPTGRYPWAREDAEGYKAAYRHFVSTCRGLAPRAAFIWSPKGEKNLRDYYPGDEYVDFVGVSLWGHQGMDEDYYGGAREFRATLAVKYDRVNGFGKPIIVAELGVSGDTGYRAAWFRSLFETLGASSRFRGLQAVVYFNDKEPHYWPNGYGSPDWRIPPGWFSMANHAGVTAAAERRSNALTACGQGGDAHVDRATSAC